jgi:uncharacterized membrane protein YbhN (UPF0104 family)
MRRLGDRPIVTTLVAFALATAVVLAIAWGWGWAEFVDAWSDPHFGWLAIAVGAEVLAFPAYVIAYRGVARTHGGPALSLRWASLVVVAGFGPFALGGGFALDKQALSAIQRNERAATVRVLGLGALEWAVLAPVVWVGAVALLIDGDPAVMKSLLWPWVIPVPIGFALGLWCAAPGRRGRFATGDGGWRGSIGHALAGVGVLYTLATRFSRYWSAWLGIALYWAFDITAFYGAVRFIGLHMNVGETVLAYGTGYALTRRSMPLGGAGATEALMTFALHWVGQPIAASVAAVAVYRFVNFALPTIPALAAHSRVKPLIADGAEARSRKQRERRRTAAPLTH